jgi:type II secretory pathway predicted ATPase ExeA
MNVRDFFKLHSTPFTSDLGYEQIFQYQQLTDLFTIIQATVDDNSMAFVSGRAGTGKTTAIRACLETFPATSHKIIYLGQDQRGQGLLARLASELGLRSNPGWNRRVLLINQRLEQQASLKKITLVVDEAHLFDLQTLEDLRLLTNQNMDRRSPISVILLAQHWLRYMLQRQTHEALYQRLRLRFALEGLTEAETHSYIKHHMALAGATKDIFERKAMPRIFAASEGILREINNICFESLMRAAALKQPSVDEKIVQWVINHREIN